MTFIPYNDASPHNSHYFYFSTPGTQDGGLLDVFRRTLHSLQRRLPLLHQLRCLDGATP